MIRRIISYFLLAFLIIAMLLFALGVREIRLQDDFYRVLSSTASETSKLKAYSIPQIPQLLPEYAPLNSIDIVYILLQLTNINIRVINFLIVAINSVIYVLEYVVILVKNVSVYISSLATI